MKQRIIIKEIEITRAGEIRLFQIPLPKRTKRVIAIATDLRRGVISAGSTKGEGSGVLGGDDTPDSAPDPQWDTSDSSLAGRLIIQSMEKANIFFYDQVWALQFDDGFSDLDNINSMSAFTVLKKKEPKAVDVPCASTVLNCLYRDTLGAVLTKDTNYFIKVLVWIEYDDESRKENA